MKRTEIAIHTIGEAPLHSILRKAFRYALLSLPWTINRMAYRGDRGYQQRMANILLGKAAEGAVRLFLLKRGVCIIPGAGSTPFWQADRYDLKIKGADGAEEWDIKLLRLRFKPNDQCPWETLPALIPDRHPRDQWALRNLCHDKDTIRKRYLFVYCTEKPLRIIWPDTVNSVLKQLIKDKDKLRPQDDYILRMLNEIKWELQTAHWSVYLTALAGPREWPLFNQAPPHSQWCGGRLETRILNRSCALYRLPSLTAWLKNTQ